jgi:hypothetical protein
MEKEQAANIAIETKKKLILNGRDNFVKPALTNRNFAANHRKIY